MVAGPCTTVKRMLLLNIFFLKNCWGKLWQRIPDSFSENHHDKYCARIPEASISLDFSLCTEISEESLDQEQ